MVIEDRIEKLIQKQEYDKHARRRQALIAEIKGFAILASSWVFVILAARLSSPIPLFAFLFIAAFCLLLKF